MAGVDAPVDPLLELRKRRYRELVAHDNPTPPTPSPWWACWPTTACRWRSSPARSATTTVARSGSQPGRGGDHRRRRRGEDVRRGRKPDPEVSAPRKRRAAQARTDRRAGIRDSVPGYGARWRPACAASPSAPPATRCGRWPRPWFRACPQACSTPCRRGTAGIRGQRAGDGDTGPAQRLFGARRAGSGTIVGSEGEHAHDIGDPVDAPQLPAASAEAVVDLGQLPTTCAFCVNTAKKPGAGHGGGQGGRLRPRRDPGRPRGAGGRGGRTQGATIDGR